MLHSSSLARRSRTNFSGLVVALSLLVAVPAFAKKKAEDAPPAAAPAASESAPVDPKLVPPTPDTFGRVHFGPSSGSDLGRVSVKAPPSDNVRVFLEGRFFGTAPITIYSVPKGDYILEGTFPDGKTHEQAGLGARERRGGRRPHRRARGARGPVQGRRHVLEQGDLRVAHDRDEGVRDRRRGRAGGRHHLRHPREDRRRATTRTRRTTSRSSTASAAPARTTRWSPTSASR